MLYQLDVSGEDVERAIELYWLYLGPGGDDATELANELVRGCAAGVSTIDDRIREASKHWRLERMARVDRNIIRLAIFELLEREDVPRKVTLNEAVELAKRYGDENSPAFVNGLLDRIATDIGKE
jgi:N utilization substance protein B